MTKKQLLYEFDHNLQDFVMASNLGPSPTKGPNLAVKGPMRIEKEQRKQIEKILKTALNQLNRKRKAMDLSRSRLSSKKMLVNTLQVGLVILILVLLITLGILAILARLFYLLLFCILLLALIAGLGLRHISSPRKGKEEAGLGNERLGEAWDAQELNKIFEEGKFENLKDCLANDMLVEHFLKVAPIKDKIDSSGEEVKIVDDLFRSGMSRSQSHQHLIESSQDVANELNRDPEDIMASKDLPSMRNVSEAPKMKSTKNKLIIKHENDKKSENRQELDNKAIFFQSSKMIVNAGPKKKKTMIADQRIESHTLLTPNGPQLRNRPRRKSKQNSSASKEAMASLKTSINSQAPNCSARKNSSNNKKNNFGLNNLRVEGEDLTISKPNTSLFTKLLLQFTILPQEMSIVQKLRLRDRLLNSEDHSSLEAIDCSGSEFRQPPVKIPMLKIKRVPSMEFKYRSAMVSCEGPRIFNSMRLEGSGIRKIQSDIRMREQRKRKTKVEISEHLRRQSSSRKQMSGWSKKNYLKKKYTIFEQSRKLIHLQKLKHSGYLEQIKSTFLR